MSSFLQADRALNNSTHSKYRPDIDGLRAVAILSVVLFHAFPSIFPGGFVGVDVFFVISGYLISFIIIKGLNNGSFTFSDFYIRRCNRIFPALIVVVALVYLFGWVSLLPSEFKQLGLHVFAGTGFFENIILWGEAGYFDSASETKPLMHLWSLAVEEQFYLFFPLIMWCAWRAKLDLFAVIALAGILSFGFNIYTIDVDPSKAFFMPYTRLWELLVGALLAYAHYKDHEAAKFLSADRNRGVFSIIGLALILIPVFMIDSKSAFPGWLALMPVVGSACIIGSGGNAWLNSKILSSKLMVFVGLISYPLYLWHWPIMSYFRILNSDNHDAISMSICIVLSFAAAWITYRFVERPIRENWKTLRKPVVLVSVVGSVGFIGLATYMLDGIDSRKVASMNPAYENRHTGISYMIKGCGLSPEDSNKFAICIKDGRGIAEFAIVGDSKAAAIYGGITRYPASGRYWTVLGGNLNDQSPVPVFSDDPSYSKFQELAKISLTRVATDDDIKVVVLVAATRNLFNLKSIDTIEDLPRSANFDVAINGLESAVNYLSSAGKKVVLVVDNPTLKDPKQCIARITNSATVNNLLGLGRQECYVTYKEHLILSKQYRDLLGTIAEKYPDTVKVFDGLEMLCDTHGGACSSFVDGRLLYSYSDHLSNFGSERVASKLVPFVYEFAHENKAGK